MVEAAGVRVPWSDLPDGVRAGVEAVLGSYVVSAVTQRGGFSPGSADRVVTADGRRAFVKAVSSEANPTSPDLHRREAAVATALPATAPVPELLGVHDDGTWVALVLSDVEGRHPRLPWRADELASTMTAYAALTAEPVSGALADLRTTGEQHADDLEGWQRLHDDPDPHLDGWAPANLDRLVDAAARAQQVLAGDRLVHGDTRADNLLVRTDGSVVVVDWPWATRGASWFDRLCLLVNVTLNDPGASPETLVARWLPEVPADDVDAVLAGLAGFFCDVARRPAPPGLPTVRAFQRAQSDVLLRWLGERWGTERRGRLPREVRETPSAGAGR